MKILNFEIIFWEGLELEKRKKGNF